MEVEPGGELPPKSRAGMIRAPAKTRSSGIDPMQRGSLTIRETTPADAEAVSALCAALAVYEGAPAPNFPPDRFRTEGFGANPAFGGFIAERDGLPVGYALHHPDYDTDRMERSVFLADLYVEKAARGLGLGRDLMAAVARAGGRYDARMMFWSVLPRNAPGRAFYKAVGGVEHPETLWCGPDAKGFAALAATPVPEAVRFDRATVADAPALARLMEALQRDQAREPHPETLVRLRRDGFGDRAFFTAMLARIEGRADPVAYALHWPTYDTEDGQRGILLSDIYVAPEARGRGIATALLGSLARERDAAGGGFIGWPVFVDNDAARRYYRRFAAEDPDTLYCTLEGEAFGRLLVDAP